MKIHKVDGLLKRVIIAVLLLSSVILFGANEKASACSQHGMVAPILEKGQITYHSDGSISGYVLMDASILEQTEVRIEGAAETEKYSFPLNTQNAVKDKVVQADRIRLNEKVDVQLYRVDINLTSQQLELQKGTFQVELFATSETTICGKPMTTRLALDEINVENPYYLLWDEKKDTQLQHPFTISFSEELDETTVNASNIYMKHNSNQKVEGLAFSLSEDRKSITIHAPQVGYVVGEEYFLYIEKEVQSASGQPLHQPIKMKFTTIPGYLLSEDQTYEGFVFNPSESKYTVKITSLDTSTSKFEGELYWEDHKQEMILNGEMSGDELFFRHEGNGSNISIGNTFTHFKLYYNPTTKNYEGTRTVSMPSFLAGWANRITTEKTILGTIALPEEVEPEPEPPTEGVLIPDPLLLEAIRNTLGKPQGEITKDDMLRLTELSVNEDGEGNVQVRNLSGIEYAENLRRFELNNAYKVDLNLLTQLDQLEELIITRSKNIDFSPVSKLKHVKKLILWRSNVKELSMVSNLKQLEYLELEYNEIQDITPLRGLTNLTDLNVRSNQISDITSLVYLSSLKHLTLHTNKITDIEVLLQLEKLEALGLKDNPLNPSSDAVLQTLRDQGVRGYY